MFFVAVLLLCSALPPSEAVRHIKLQHGLPATLSSCRDYRTHTWVSAETVHMILLHAWILDRKPYVAGGSLSRKLTVVVSLR